MISQNGNQVQVHPAQIAVTVTFEPQTGSIRPFILGMDTLRGLPLELVMKMAAMLIARTDTVTANVVHHAASVGMHVPAVSDQIKADVEAIKAADRKSAQPKLVLPNGPINGEELRNPKPAI